MTNISIGAILGLVGTIGTLIMVLSLVGIINSALAGDTETVEKQLDEFVDDSLDDAKKIPFEPIKPYIIGGVAIILTAICSILGIPLVFRR